MNRLSKPFEVRSIIDARGQLSDDLGDSPHHSLEVMLELERQIVICLALIRGATRHSYGGRGVKRRRDVFSAKIMAEQIATNVLVSYTFAGADKNAIEAEIEATLIAVPDPVAFAYADKLSMISNPAKAEIAGMITEALITKWPVIYTPATPTPHSR